MESFLNFLNNLDKKLPPFSTPAWNELTTALSLKSYQKKEPLLLEGQLCNYLFYIESGFCKTCHNVEGKIINCLFYFENQIVTDIQSFGGDSLATKSIIACSPMRVTRIHKAPLFKAAAEFAEIDAIGRACIRQFAARQDEFSALLQTRDAAGCLAYLEDHHPEFIQRVPNYELASFLGVSRETLSRIRNRRRPG